MLTIMESVNWVCEDAFNDQHEWVTQLTMSEWEEHVLVDLDYDIDVPCVVQWALLWFSAPSRSNQYFEGNGTHSEVYHEVTPSVGPVEDLTMEITLHIVVESVAVVLGRVTDQDWDLDRELKGWGPRGDSDVLSGVRGDGEDDYSVE